MLLMTHGYSATDVGESVARTVELCRQVDDRGRLLVATWRLLSFHILRAEYASTRRLALSLLDHPAAAHDSTFPATGHRALGVVALSAGDLVGAQAHLVQAIAAMGGGADPTGVGAFEVLPAAFARDFLALTLWLRGDADGGGQMMGEALAVARDGGPFSESFSQYLAAMRGVFGNDVDAVRRHAHASHALAVRHGFALNEAIASALLAWADGTVARMKEALTAGARAGASQWRHFLLTLLAQVLWRRRRGRSALAVLDTALAHTAETGEGFYEPEIHRLRAEIHGSSGDGAAAAGALEEAVASARSQSSLVFLERALAGVARLSG